MEKTTMFNKKLSLFFVAWVSLLFNCPIKTMQSQNNSNIIKYCNVLRQFQQFEFLQINEDNLKNYQKLLEKFNLFSKGSNEYATVAIATFENYFKTIMNNSQQIANITNQTNLTVNISLVDINNLLEVLIDSITQKQIDNNNNFLYEPICSKILLYAFQNLQNFGYRNFTYLCILLSKGNLLPSLNTPMDSNFNTFFMYLATIPPSEDLMRLLKNILYKMQGKKYNWQAFFRRCNSNGDTVLHLAAQQVIYSDIVLKFILQLIKTNLSFTDYTNLLQQKNNQGLTFAIITHQIQEELILKNIDKYYTHFQKFQNQNYEPLKFTSNNLTLHKELLINICKKNPSFAKSILYIFRKLLTEIIETYQLANKNLHSDIKSTKPISDDELQDLCEKYGAVQELPNFDNQINKFPDITLIDINIMLEMIVRLISGYDKDAPENWKPICIKILSYVFENYHIFESHAIVCLCGFLAEINLLPSLDTIVDKSKNLSLFTLLISISKDIRSLNKIIEKQTNVLENQIVLGSINLQTMKNYWYKLFTIRDYNNWTALHHAAAKLSPFNHQAGAKNIFEMLLKIILDNQWDDLLYKKDITDLMPLNILSCYGYAIDSHSCTLVKQ